MMCNKYKATQLVVQKLRSLYTYIIIMYYYNYSQLLLVICNMAKAFTVTSPLPPSLLIICSPSGSKFALPSVICLFLILHCSSVLSAMLKLYPEGKQLHSQLFQRATFNNPIHLLRVLLVALLLKQIDLSSCREVSEVFHVEHQANVKK